MGHDDEVPFVMALGMVRSISEPPMFLVLLLRRFHREGAVGGYVMYSWYPDALSSVQSDEQLRVGLIVAAGAVREVTLLLEKKKGHPSVPIKVF